ncbi:SusD/RagB family nutrient-binding outer membrane lipoprotein [Pedobacter sp. AW31-3R]|uniref:SusD/RagB family nutrient-binding outer membrane lipoprotein n=1 Tax=Pedobacter sp. AW31-3R TaxID=3445781 RepID=UPI003FA03264
MKKFAILFLLATVSLAGCKKLLDVNDDPNRPIDVQEALILSPVEVAISDYLYAGNANIIAQDWLQATAPNQPNPGFWNYQTFNNTWDSDWYNAYVVCLNNLNLLNKKALSTGNTNYQAISKVLTAYSLAYATDIWGDVPYTQALNGTDMLTPVYDSQENIYKIIQSLLDEAIVLVNQNYAALPGSDDFYYNGDMAKWKKLAYTLKARYYLHLTKAPGYTAAAQADLALAALENGISTDAEDLKMTYSGVAGSENPWNLTFGPVTTKVLNETFVENLRSTGDPRLSKMVAPATATGLYTGKRIGAIPGVLNTYSLGGAYYAGENASNYLLTYTEAQFIKAEATLIKSGAAAAQPIFTAAVTNHMNRLGIAGTDITTYLAAKGTLTTANALRRIIEEKSTANFLNPENYNDWRRTGFPLLTKVDGALSDIPRRAMYPETELTTNPQPQQTAKVTDRVWWDTNN